jgi:hypothetical protein
MEAKRPAEQIEKRSIQTGDQVSEPKPQTKKRRRVKTFGSFF